jgi:hypothetical protein
MKIKDIKIKYDNGDGEKGTITFLMDDNNNYLSTSIKFKYLQKKWFIFDSTIISDLQITFIKNHMRHKDFINTIHIKSLSEINTIKKKDHFDINLGKSNKEFLNTLLYFILCKRDYIKKELIEMCKVYDDYKRYTWFTDLLLKYINSDISNCIVHNINNDKHNHDIEIKCGELISQHTTVLIFWCND